MSKPLDTKHICDNMYYIRKHVLKQSQEEFAELIDISKDTVSNIERGKYLPNLATLVNVANKTKTPITFFLEEMEDE